MGAHQRDATCGRWSLNPTAGIFTGRAAGFLPRLLLAAAALVVPSLAYGADAAYHHVHLNVPQPDEALQWYIRQMGCRPRAGRKDACDCGASTYLAFYTRPHKGPSDGSAVNHIGFSFEDLTAKMQDFEAAGIKIVLPLREVPGLFKMALIEDPWGTRIEVVEDVEHLGFHHVHLQSADPVATLKWYRAVFGGEPRKLRGVLDGVLYGRVWLLATHETGSIAPTEGRAIEHLGFAFADLDAATAAIKANGFVLSQDVRVLTNGPIAKNAFIVSPDGVRIELAQPLPGAR